MLSDIQKSSARFHGAAEFAKRRSHLRRLRTSLAELRRGAAEADAEDLYKGWRALERLLLALEADINESRAIKRDWDKRMSGATLALQAIPVASVADVIALADLDHSLGRPAALLEQIEAWGWQNVADQLRHEAVASLAHRCARAAGPTAEFVDAVRDAMPGAAAKHANLIQKINTLAVARTIERAARQPVGES